MTGDQDSPSSNQRKHIQCTMCYFHSTNTKQKWYSVLCKKICKISKICLLYRNTKTDPVQITAAGKTSQLLQPTSANNSNCKDTIDIALDIGYSNFKQGWGARLSFSDWLRCQKAILGVKSELWCQV